MSTLNINLKPYTVELPGATYEVEADCWPVFKPKEIVLHIKSVTFEEPVIEWLFQKTVEEHLPEIENKVKELYQEDDGFTDDNSAD